MTYLRKSKLFRCGATSKGPMRQEDTLIVAYANERILVIDTMIASKGGGYTDITMKIARADFKHLLQAMLDADETYTRWAIKKIAGLPDDD